MMSPSASVVILYCFLLQTNSAFCFTSCFVYLMLSRFSNTIFCIKSDLRIFLCFFQRNILKLPFNFSVFFYRASSKLLSRLWLSGRMLALYAIGRGSIPGRAGTLSESYV